MLIHLLRLGILAQLWLFNVPMGGQLRRPEAADNLRSCKSRYKLVCTVRPRYSYVPYNDNLATPIEFIHLDKLFTQ